MELAPQKPKRDYVLPASILIAALLIAVALVYNAGKGSESSLSSNLSSAVTPAPDRVQPVKAGDHVLGDLKAPVKIIAFTDFECPFCKEFHLTLKHAVEAYQGKIAVVYRHFPLDELHSKARKEAVASECAAELGGNDAFWRFVDQIFEITPSNDGLDPAELPKIAAGIGLDRSVFEACLSSNRHADAVERDAEDARNAGARGTPYAVIEVPSGHTYVIPGAFPFEDDRSGYPSVKAILDIVFEEEHL